MNWFSCVALSGLALLVGVACTEGSNPDDPYAAGGTSAGSGGSVTAGAGGTSNKAGNGGANNGGSGPVERKLRTVGYLPTYRGSFSTWARALDFKMLSYLDVCFPRVDSSGNLSFQDTTLPALVDAAHAAGTKVCVAIGGASSAEKPETYQALVAPGARDGFVQKILDFTLANNLDCVDIDLEGASVNADYGPFVEALSAKLKPQNKEITAAVAKWFGSNISDSALQAFDFINVMAYDFCWGAIEACDASSIEDAQSELDYWVVARQVPRAKTVLGVPFYGYRWRSGEAGEALTFADIIAEHPQAATEDRITTSDGVITLNSKTTMGKKTQLAATYGGIMIWELGQDTTDQAMLRAIHEAQ